MEGSGFFFLFWMLCLFQQNDIPAKCYSEEESTPSSRTLFLLHLIKNKLKLQTLEKIQQLSSSGPVVGCICVPYYLCSINNTIIAGTTVVDVRYRPCTGNLEVCCFPSTTVSLNPTTATTRMTSTTVRTTITTTLGPVTRAPTLPTTQPTTPTTLTTRMATSLIQPTCNCMPNYQCYPGQPVIINPRQVYNCPTCCPIAYVCCTPYYPTGMITIIY